LPSAQNGLHVCELVTSVTPMVPRGWSVA
jgi:hypothetical protein